MRFGEGSTFPAERSLSQLRMPRLLVAQPILLEDAAQAVELTLPLAQRALPPVIGRGDGRRGGDR